MYTMLSTLVKNIFSKSYNNVYKLLALSQQQSAMSNHS